MDALALGRWGRRRRPEELPDPGDAKCRRLEATMPQDGLQVKVGALAIPSCEEHGPPDPRLQGDPGHTNTQVPRDSGRIPAQFCPRCVAGESGHFSHSAMR